MSTDLLNPLNLTSMPSMRQGELLKIDHQLRPTTITTQYFPINYRHLPFTDHFNSHHLRELTLVEKIRRFIIRPFLYQITHLFLSIPNSITLESKCKWRSGFFYRTDNYIGLLYHKTRKSRQYFHCSNFFFILRTLGERKIPTLCIR